MKLKEAIQLLKDHNKWRRYDGEIDESPEMTDPKKLGIAIDTVVNKFENLFISSVVKSSCDTVDLSFVLSEHHKYILENKYIRNYIDTELVAFEFMGMDYEEQKVVKN